jgi:ATP-dependent helicase/nuclease subunit A
MRAQADFLRPFEMIERMLIRHGGRRRLVARLGPEAEDGIDALLDQALAYEAVEPPSLTGFLAWIDRDEVAVKRRSEEGADQVRVMTVHGAKGLEAPIVFLPDTAVRHDGSNPPQVVRLEDGQPAWRQASGEAPPAVARAEADRRRLVRLENRRLLYVALTRAQRWLIVCGAGVPANGSGESWHGLVGDAMEALAPVAVADDGGRTLLLSHNWQVAPAERGPTARGGAAPPDWLRTPAGRPAEPPRLVSPSALGGAFAGGAETQGDAEAARVRGTIQPDLRTD